MEVFQFNVNFLTIDLHPYLSVLKLFTFNWYVGVDLILEFSRNLEERNLFLELPGVLLLRQSFTNKIFWSMMKQFSLSTFISYICFLEVNGRKSIILIDFSWIFSIFTNLHFDLVFICGNYILNLSWIMKSKGFSMCALGAKCVLFARSPIPALSLFFSLLKYKFQSGCSFIVRPNYLTCVVCGIYWAMILKFSCFVLSLLYLGMNSKISVLLVFIYILFALSHVVRRFKSCFFYLF